MDPSDPSKIHYKETVGYLKIWKWLAANPVAPGTTDLLKLERGDKAIASLVTY